MLLMAFASPSLPQYEGSQYVTSGLTGDGADESLVWRWLRAGVAGKHQARTLCC